MHASKESRKKFEDGLFLGSLIRCRWSSTLGVSLLTIWQVLVEEIQKAYGKEEVRPHD